MMARRQEEGQGMDSEKEKRSLPRRRTRCQPSEKKDSPASDDSMESQVDDSDLDADYKEESSKDDSPEPSDDDSVPAAKTKDQTAKKAKAET